MYIYTYETRRIQMYPYRRMNEWNLNFLQTGLLATHHTYSIEFFISRSTSETIDVGKNLCSYVSFNAL